MRRTEDGLIPTVLAIAGALQWVASWGGAWLVSATTRSTVSAGSGGMREGRVLSRVNPSIPSCMKRSCQRPTTVFALADSAGDGGGTLAVGCQNNDPRPPNVLLRAVAIANDRVQPNPILRRDGDGNSLAHHRHSHKIEPSETPIRTLLSGAIHWLATPTTNSGVTR